MVKLMGLDGTILYVNYFQILYIEQIPETKVIMSNGHYYLVKDSVESIQEQIVSFLRSCLAAEKRELLADN
ncbi:MAG: flagellar FlbD family protein [Lachnospiraceae bacterium]|nr:flagellar FlbD family protein [Lachnospiraceae bacterium]